MSTNENIVIIDGNEAAAYVAYRLSEVIAIYPITPSSSMAELADAWSSDKIKNIWGQIPDIIEMQSESGAAGTVHGALQGGALSTTFTASQGLLLMIPNMYKIAGELTPAVFHVAARTLATHALSIFGDHSDVMACRQTGFAMLCSNSVQEVNDFALIAHAATLEVRIPFIHFFDGFRTSHELMKINLLQEETIKSMVDEKLVNKYRSYCLNPENPLIRGTAQNPDVFFQAREACNNYYYNTPAIVQKYMDKLAQLTGRTYHLFDYVGAKDAKQLIILMGSGAETVTETVKYLNAHGASVGVLKVRLYRPFAVEAFINALPANVESIAVLDRTKEPGAVGEPLYQDVISALVEKGKTNIKVIGGRYGLSSKEFTPAMVKAIFDELKKEKPKQHFTVGINDDLTHLSLDYDTNFSIEDPESFRGIFIGLGSDGTVGANKNSIKIIAETTDFSAQGYFVYDSKKSGSITKSYLRFGKKEIHAPYLTKKATFIGCHQFHFIETTDVLGEAADGATLLLNSPYGADQTWDYLPKHIQEEMLKKHIKLYVINAYEVAKLTGMGNRINTIMQTCFFNIANVIPAAQAIEEIKYHIKKSFGKKGDEIVKRNCEAVDETIKHLRQVNLPSSVTSKVSKATVVPDSAPEFVKNVTAKIIAGEGDTLPVSALPADGTFPTDTTQWEKRNIAQEVPVWNAELCIQCGKCTLVCPHAVIRLKAYNQVLLKDAPSSFKSKAVRGKEFPEGTVYTIQVAVEDCTGCELCVYNCPAKDKADPNKKAINMLKQLPLRETERKNLEFFDSLPDYDRTALKLNSVKDSQLLQPLFEYSGCCAGCGETPYIKLVSQLFGDRMLVANATGCSSIYGGNLPTTPWAKNKDGRGPAWANSLFEDNAEFGLGIRLAVMHKTNRALSLLINLKEQLAAELVDYLISNAQSSEAEIAEQRKQVGVLKEQLQKLSSDAAHELLVIADYLVKKSVWIIGGDGWAYDIGYGGLDHVLASGQNINVLLLDTEVYSNTGGQMSKSTPIGAVAKFASGGKTAKKKDIGLLAMSYGNIYVAKVAMGANDAQTVKAIVEAEAYDGPSLIICYSHCIAHGFDLKNGLNQQKLAVDSGHWILYRYNPDLIKEGKNPLILDSREPKIPLTDYVYNETRYKVLQKANPNLAQTLIEKAQKDVQDNWKMYSNLANRAV
ncbi:MAG: pyruvate:ferredoxin (flavodoxin) oxidoreductase [Deltaproteobacteria bacterium]|jgi:pyruvate-ferredoxin/flavodoxin oxidoreductase|nr:pyruvate:ferredoxin (flavodoxin) oxidoreductase [Deltaproteobacteria bacterium]